MRYGSRFLYWLDRIEGGDCFYNALLVAGKVFRVRCLCHYLQYNSEAAQPAAKDLVRRELGAGNSLAEEHVIALPFSSSTPSHPSAITAYPPESFIHHILLSIGIPRYEPSRASQRDPATELLPSSKLIWSNILLHSITHRLLSRRQARSLPSRRRL